MIPVGNNLFCVDADLGIGNAHDDAIAGS